MLLTDINILVYAHNPTSENHEEYRSWLEQVLNGDESFGLSDLVVSGFVRIATNPRIFNSPSTLDQAFTFAEQLRSNDNCVPVNPGPRHWDIFRGLCKAADARGNLVTDAYLAALAIESGCEWITVDRDFSRFPGLRWRNPLESR